MSCNSTAAAFPRTRVLAACRQRSRSSGHGRGQLVDSFGVKVLCSRQPTSDTALSSRALHISMVPTLKNLQALDEETVERIANDFQPRLSDVSPSALPRISSRAPGPFTLSPRMQ